jgi:hypothetical protein
MFARVMGLALRPLEGVSPQDAFLALQVSFAFTPGNLVTSTGGAVGGNGDEASPTMWSTEDKTPQARK